MDSEHTEHEAQTPGAAALSAPVSHGAIGGVPAVQWYNSSDVRLAGRALLEQWPNPPEKRAALMGMLYDTALGGEHEVRDRLYAANVIAKLHAQNLVGEREGPGALLGKAAELAHAIVQLGRQGAAPAATGPLLTAPTDGAPGSA